VYPVVGSVHEFGRRLVLNEASNKWQVEKGQSVLATSVFDRIYILLSTTVVASVKGIHPHCSGHLHSLEQDKVQVE